jgi:hypothetical protein
MSWFKKKKKAEHPWYIPISLATWETQIRRIVVPDQPRQIVHKTPSPK